METRSASAVLEQSTDKTFTFVASDATVDRMGDVIDPKGWQLGSFKSNPVILFNHNHNEPIGRAVDVSLKGDKLVADIEFMDESVSPFAAKIARMVRAGFIKAVSVGFRALEAKPMEKSGGYLFTKSELLEISVVSVPANPSALAVAKAFDFTSDEITRTFAHQVQADPLAWEKAAVDVLLARGRV